ADREVRRLLDKNKDDYLEVHVRHVLAKDKATAEAARQELVRGDEWATVAKRHSIDTQSKDKAGDLGFNARGATVKQFEEAEFALAGQGDCKGQSSGSCESPISQPGESEE